MLGTQARQSNRQPTGLDTRITVTYPGSSDMILYPYMTETVVRLPIRIMTETTLRIPIRIMMETTLRSWTIYNKSCYILLDKSI